MRLTIFSTLSVFAAALCSFSTPAIAQDTISTFSSYGSNRAEACSSAKSNAQDVYHGYGAMRIVRFSSCECSDRGTETARNMRWYCSVDATLRKSD